MPLYGYKCDKCGKVKEVLASIDASHPQCCGEVMTRQLSIIARIKMKYPLWVDRIDDINKARADKGLRERIVHPSEVGAN